MIGIIRDKDGQEVVGFQAALTELEISFEMHFTCGMTSASDPPKLKTTTSSRSSLM